ncbi:MAG: leucine-rich repeat protein [Ruminiclostridium sp.]|nr:leucine-rich repeat protein [Ruminiclostridium sp.]
MSKRKTIAILLTASLALGGCAGNSSPKETLYTEWNAESFMSELEESMSAEQEALEASYKTSINEQKVNTTETEPYYEVETTTEIQPEEDTDEYIGEESDEMFTYDVYEKHVEVKKVIGKVGRELTIPDEYNGVPVTIIGESACDSNGSLTKLVIGANVEEIGYSAFSNDEMLLSVESKAPEKLKRIGNNAFINCEMLSVFPVILPNLENIGISAFEKTSIKEFTVPTGVKIIAERSFLGCKKLKNLIIEEGVEEIEYLAFADSGISSIVIPDSVTYIKSGLNKSPFLGCDDLKEITVGSGIKEFELCLFAGRVLGSIYYTNIEKITLSEGLEVIGSGVFEYCNKLKEIEIPKSVKSISADSTVSRGFGTFEHCESLETVILNEGLETIGEDAFNNCASLKSIDIPNTVTSLGDHAFEYCGSLTEVTVPGSVAVIEGGTFGYCDSLKKVTFNDGVLKLNGYIFSALDRYESITDVILPDSLVYADESSLWVANRNGHAVQANMKVTYKGKQYTYEQKDELLSLING